jgi:hypothetical protein
LITKQTSLLEISIKEAGKRKKRRKVRHNTWSGGWPKKGWYTNEWSSKWVAEDHHGGSETGLEYEGMDEAQAILGRKPLPQPPKSKPPMHLWQPAKTQPDGCRTNEGYNKDWDAEWMHNTDDNDESDDETRAVHEQKPAPQQPKSPPPAHLTHPGPKIVLEIATFQSSVVRKKSQKKKNDYFRLVDTDTAELVALWFRADEISSSTYKGTDEYYLKTTALLPSIHSKGLSIHVGIQPDRLRN